MMVTPTTVTSLVVALVRIHISSGKWHREAGYVRGNTVVDITGGHILTSIYGGNEHTDVGIPKKINNEASIPKSGGLCTVNFGGTATLGVPRTLEQIAAHPVTCYLFGAGKGDQRVFFNTWTNISEAEVNITGGAASMALYSVAVRMVT